MKGAELESEDIQQAMARLEEEYQSIMQHDTNDNEGYIRRCALLQQKLLMLHPYSDANGRTSRILLSVLMAKRDIVLPSVLHTYYDRFNGEEYIEASDDLAKGKGSERFCDYILRRVKENNAGCIHSVSNTELLNIAKTVNVKDLFSYGPVLLNNTEETRGNNLTIKRKGEKSDD